MKAKAVEVLADVLGKLDDAREVRAAAQAPAKRPVPPGIIM